MTTTPYAEKLRDPRWQKVRLHTLNASGWRCSHCGDEGSTLNVHHKKYTWGREPWEYPPQELEVLCQPCHQELHKADKFIKSALSALSHEQKRQVAALLAGFLDLPSADYLADEPWGGQMARLMCQMNVHDQCELMDMAHARHKQFADQRRRHE